MTAILYRSMQSVTPASNVLNSLSSVQEVCSAIMPRSICRAAAAKPNGTARRGYDDEGELKEPYDSIPMQIRDWSVVEEDRFYDRATLADDGSELYLSFDLQEAFIRRYTKVDDPDLEIVLDVYDMGTSEEAFGIFSCEREDQDIGVGQGSEYGGGVLRFWKNRFFVSMVSLGDEEYAEPAMMDIARGVADAISGEGTRPHLASRLPSEGLLESELRYFHTMQCLNDYYVLGGENTLALDEETNCVIGPYEREDEAGFLLLVEYGNEQKARAAFKGFLSSYFLKAESPGIVQKRNGRWAHAKHEGPFILAVFDAPNPEWSEKLLSEVKVP